MSKKCIFCGRHDVRQPALPLGIVMAGSVPMCEYHFKLYRDWASDKEWDAMRKIVKEYLKKEGYDGTNGDP